MRKVIGKAPESEQYEMSSFSEFLLWIRAQQVYQLDIETNVTDEWSTKKLITIQFGSEDGSLTWLLQWSFLTPEEQALLKEELENDKVLKIIHNGVFEAVVLLFHGIEIDNIYDTMLVEMILTAGLHEVGTKGVYGLADVTSKYVRKTVSKAEQTNFGDDCLTENKVLYALEDVTNMGLIKKAQMTEVTHQNLGWVVSLENTALLGFAEMTYNGLTLNKDKWRENLAFVEPLVHEAERKLNEWLIKEPFFTKAKALGYVSDQDRVEIKWGSPQQRKFLLQLVFPEISGASLGVVKKYWKDHKTTMGLVECMILEDFLAKDYGKLESYVLEIFRDQLVERELVTPAGTVTLNWNSQAQVLPLFRLFAPKLKDLSAESLAKVSHPMLKDYEEYKDNLKLVSTYGEEFIEKYVEPDGNIRSTYNQIVSTGRISSKKPNLQNIPVKESVGARYREAFEAPEGWDIVSSDYSSQELVLVAHLSQDPVFIEALDKDQDLHSVAAELVFGAEWKAGAEETCEYYHAGKVKCSCKKHKVMRGRVKTINYGLVYGMGEMKLAGMLDITVQEAKALTVRYFKAFPKIKTLLDYLGNFAVTNGYSMTPPPFYRRRWYPWWKFAKPYIAAHIQGIEYNATLGSIERQGKNMPIQGGSADMTKYAIVLIRKYIKDNNLKDKVKLVLQVHDEVVTRVRHDYTETWKPILGKLMADAAKVVIPSGLLKSETTSIGRSWTK